MPKYPARQASPKSTQWYRSKTQSQSITTSNKKDSSKRAGISRQFPPSKFDSSTTKLRKPAISTASTARSGLASGRKTDPLCGTMGRVHRQQMSSLYRPKRFQESIPDKTSSFICSDQNESIIFTFTPRIDRSASQKTAVERVQNPGTPGFYSLLFLVPKKKKKKKRTESNGQL